MNDYQELNKKIKAERREKWIKEMREAEHAPNYYSNAFIIEKLRKYIEELEHNKAISQGYLDNFEFPKWIVEKTKHRIIIEEQIIKKLKEIIL